MNRFKLLFAFLISNFLSTAQTQSITFTIGNNGIVTSSNVDSATRLKAMSLTAGDPIKIVVNNPSGKTFKFQIKNGNSLVKYSQADFVQDGHFISTDGQLIFTRDGQTVALKNATIDLTFSVQGGSPITFTLKTTVKPRAEGAGNPDLNQPAPRTAYHPGITYYDARALTFEGAVKKKEFLDIVAYYFGGSINYVAEALTVLRQDDVLKEIKWDNLDSTKFISDTEAVTESLIPIKGLSALGSLGGIDVTNIANGIAQFMIKRAKEELTIAFFNRFKEFVEKNEEFRVLFPKTTDNLENLLAYKYPDMLPALRTGFFEDLKTITYHLDDVLELPRYQRLLKNFPEIRVAIRSIRLVHEIESGDSDAATVIEEFARFPEWKDSTSSIGFKNFGNSVRLGSLFSHSLRNDTTVSKDTTRAWITFKQVDTLVKNEQFYKIYIGLMRLLVNKEGIRFYTAQGGVRFFNDIILEQKENLFLFQNKTKEFIELANKVDKTLDTLKDKKRKDMALTNDDYHNYIDVSLDVIDYGFSIAKLFDENIKSDEYVKIARKSNDLYRNIYKTEYTQAVSNAMDILTSIKDMVNSTKDSLLPQLLKIHERDSIYKKSFEKLKDGDIANFKLTLSGSVDSITRVLLNKVIAYYEQGEKFGKLGDIITKLTRYGLFIANLADAKTPDEVEAILDNAVLPVGSSSIKKNSRFNLAVQSYLGAFYRASNLKQENNNAWNSRFGVTAPIGVAASWGLRGKSGSFSLFGSLIDLGAIVDYQLKKDSVATPSGGDEEVIKKDYKIRLGQIFSPGIYAVYGFWRNIPLSFGAGAQYGPGLGKIENSGNLIENNPQWKFNIFLAVDIPFFNMVNLPKRYKPKH